MQERSNSLTQGQIIAVGAVVAIILILAMGAVGPGSWAMRKWNESQGYSQTTQQAPATGTSIVGGPSLSAAQINTILQCGESSSWKRTFYNDSQQYGIDDAVALAFFKHESTYGLYGAAAQTMNMGNIVCSDGYNCIGRFRSYGSWSEGITDWYKLISGPAYAGGGLTTIPQIIPKYAPASDGNSESSYIAAVQADVQSWRQS